MSSDRSQALAPQKAGSTVRSEFGAESMERTGETASSVMAAQAEAMIKASFTMAIRYPRDWADVREKLKRAVERPGFAEGILDPGETDRTKAKGAAWYNKPVGQGVQGFSIRFAEEAVRAMRNISVQTLPVYDDDEKRILIVDVVDLENNLHFPNSVVVEKTIERKFPKKGDDVIRARQNSKGEAVYILRATDDEVLGKQNNLISKAMRNSVLRLLPGDIQAECRQRILEIRQGDIAKDPDKAKRDISDAFAALNVMPSALKDYLGHDLGTSTPAEIADLRDLYKAIKEGDFTMQEAITQARYERDEPSPDAEPKQSNGAADKLKAELKKKQEAATGAPPDEPKGETTKPATEASSTATREPGEEEEEPGPMDRKAAISHIEKLIADITANNNFSGNAYDFIEQYAGKGIRKVAKIPDDKLGNVIDGLNLEKEKLQ